MQELKYENLSQEEKELLQAASDAGAHYFNKKGTRRVGAALLCENGKTYQGTSIRRTNVSNSTCAERMALDKALFDRCYDYKLLAIIGFYDDDSKVVVPPCGLCRQILSEAETYGQTHKAIPILIANDGFSTVIRTDSQELFPMAYEGKVYKK
jgi:cytidine deaminase